MAFDPIATLREWKHKVASLQERWRGARRENEQLRQENEQLRRREKQLEQEREQLRARSGENEKLKRQLEQAQRASKRQAAPFSRGTRKQNPKTPGRKSGSAYGQRHSKAIPPNVDEVIAVPPPAQCDVRWSPESREDRGAIPTGNRAPDVLATLRCSGLSLSEVPQTGARARSAADLRRPGSGGRAIRTRRVGAGREDE